METIERKPRFRKIVRTAGIVVVAVLLLLAGANLWIGRIVRQKIEKEVAEQTGGMCRISIDRVRLNPVGRSLRLKGIVLTTDSLLLAKRHPGLRMFRLTAAQLSIGGIRLTQQDGDRTPTIAEIEVSAPHVDIVRNFSDSVPPVDSLQRASGQIVRTIGFGRLRIADGSVTYCEIRNGRQTCHTLRGLSVQTDDFRLNAGNANDNGWLDNGIRTSVESVNYQLDEGAVALQADTLIIDTRKGECSVAGVRLLPQYPKSEFASLAAGHPDWTQVVAGRIACTGVDYPEIARNKKLKIDSVWIGNVEIGSFKNRQIPQKQRIKPLFYQSLQKLSFGVEVRRISFSDIRAVYEELSATGTVPGTVTFDSLRGDLYGLANAASPEHPRITLKASGRLMNRGVLQATFLLPADSLDDRFEVDGKLGPMELQAMNRAIEPLVNARINTGRIDGMNFRIAGDSRQADVQLLLLYDSLNVSLMKQEKDGPKARRLLSAIVDDLLIRTGNPEDGVTRTGEGVTERDPYRSQFNYLWKSLMPGIKQTVVGHGTVVKRHRHRDDRR